MRYIGRNMMRFKMLILLGLVLSIMIQAGCYKIDQPVSGESILTSTAVSIIDKDTYYEAVINYKDNLGYKAIGQQYGKAILEMVPNYEQLIDSFLKEVCKNDFIYTKTINERVPDVITQLKPEYREEIEGIASVFSGGNTDVPGDGKVSLNEFYLFSLVPDVLRGTQCSVVSVFHDRSETGKNIIARNLDWYGGSNNQLPKIQAIVYLKSDKNEVCSIGYLGYMGIITAINDKKVFAAILDSPTGTSYNSQGKRSYPFDLRDALENENSIEQVADFMKDSKKYYAFNHLIALADSDETKVLENNFTGTRENNARVKRELRCWDTPLNKDVEWGISNAIAGVNSFILKGNYDNHTTFKHNTARWKTVREQLLAKGDKVSFEELREIISFDSGEPTYADRGDLYCKLTQQTIIIQPSTLRAEISFYPKEELNPYRDPIFQSIEIFKN